MSAQVDLTQLWEHLQHGDRSAATRIVEHFINNGEEPQAAMASAAIVRHFSRAAKREIDAARAKSGEERRKHFANAVEALLSAAVARRLPALLTSDGAAANTSSTAAFPIPNITVTGLASPIGIELTWVASTVPVGLRALRAQAIDASGTTVADSGVVPALAGLIALTGLTAGLNYIIQLTAFAQDANYTSTLVAQAGTLTAAAGAVTGLSAAPVVDGLNLSWVNPTGSTLSGLTLVVLGVGTPRVFNFTTAPLPTTQNITGLVGGSAYGVIIQPIYTAAGISTLGPVATLTQVPLAPSPTLPARPILTPSDFPIPNLLALGIPGGISLQWVDTAVPEGVYGIRAQAFDQTGSVGDSGLIDPLLGQLVIAGLTDGAKYVLNIATFSQTQSVVQCVIRAGILPTESLARVSGLALAPNTAPNALAYSWTNPTPPSGDTLTGLVATVAGGGTTQVFNFTQSPLPSSLLVTGLITGLPYTLAIEPIYSTADGSAIGELQYLTASAGTSPLDGTPFIPSVASLPNDPIFFLDPSLETPLANAMALLTSASRVGSKFTFDYLKEQATRAAGEALTFDSQIIGLMGMTLSKAQAAAGDLTPTVIAAIQALQKDTQTIGAVASATPVTDAISTLSSDVARFLIFEAVLAYLATTDAFDLWIGFFNALIDDISSFNTSFDNVRAFFASEESGFTATIQTIAQQELNQVNATVDAAVAPIKAAVAGIIGASSAEMGRVFASFDLPLLMAQGISKQPNLQSGNTLVPNVNPLNTDLQSLQNAVAGLAEQIKAELRQSLLGIINGADSVFLDIMIAYFTIPLVVALAVAIAGGPIAAALLAAIIAIAAEELISLIAGWLTGPLNSQLAALEGTVQSDMLALVAAIRNQVPLTSLLNPQSVLRLAENQLRELSALLPQAFLEDLAALFGEARTQRMQDAIKSALAAEQALGFENATAFDRIRYAYQSAVAVPAQMPGSGDGDFLTPAALLADLGQLEQDLSQVDDGREIQITRRISLAQILGDSLASFLQSGLCSVVLEPSALLSNTAPGAYRTLITDISVMALSELPADSSGLLGGGLSVTLTHSKDSWTRIKANANTAAPPIAMPAGFPDRAAFVLAASYSSPKLWPLSPNTLEGKIWSIITGITSNATWDNIRKACLDMLPQAIADLGNITYVGLTGASASNTQAGYEPYHVLHEDRNSYYSSAAAGSSTDTVTLTVELGTPSEVITGLRMWPRSGKQGFPSQFTFFVSDVSTEGTFRPIAGAVTSEIKTTGEEAYYVHFAPVTGQYVRIVATGLAQIGASYYFQVCNVQVEAMNVVANALPLASPKSNSEDPAHPVTNLLSTDSTKYYSSLTYQQPNPTNAPYFTVKLPALAPLVHVRLTPRQDGASPNFPSAFRIQLRGKDTIPFGFTNYSIVGTQAADFYFSPYQTGEWFFVADTLSNATGQYALQLGQMTASSMSSRPSMIPAQALESLVTAALNAMPWPPIPQYDPVQAATAIAAALVQGLSGSSINDVAGTAWDNVNNDWLGRVAKWSGAQMENDPDPSIRALNFVRLSRQSDPETVTLDLFPTQQSPGQSGVLLTPLERNVFTDSRQYQPFQNLGLGGTLDIEAPQIAQWAVVDLIVQITMRACYSQQLAACVKAGRTQILQQIARVNSAGSGGRVLQLGQAAAATGTSDVRTVKFSLRTQRDRILQSAIAAAQLYQGKVSIDYPVTVDGITLTQAVPPLSLGQPFSYFATPGSNLITVKFTTDQTSTLASQLNTIAITPETLGVDLSLLSGDVTLLSPTPPQLVGIAVIFVPIGNMLAPFTATAKATASSLNNLLGSKWKPGDTLPYVTMTTPDLADANAIDLKDLWVSSGTPLSFSFDVSNAIGNGQLYDVIISLSYSPPSLTALPSDAGALTALGAFA
jgi:hypothetical protein